MRFNDKEIAKVGEGPAVIEGILHHMRPQENDWSVWYQQNSFKERTFKLVANILFYYRVNEPEPLGILILEDVQVAYERPYKGIPFAFSLTFKVRDNERKHILSCRCAEDVNKWVSVLKVASYEHWRSQYIILKTKLSMRTGKDPVLDYLRKRQESKAQNSKWDSPVGAKKSTFHSHITSNGLSETRVDSSSVVPQTTTGTVTRNEAVLNGGDLNSITFNSDGVTLGKLIDI